MGRMVILLSLKQRQRKGITGSIEVLDDKCRQEIS